MSSFRDLFAGVNFVGTVQRYCNDAGWRIAELNNESARIKFNMQSGSTQTVYILKYESTLEFSVPSVAGFDTDDDIPHFLSTLLLQRSSRNKIGFWCLEKIGGKQVYSYMHNAEMQLIDSAYFARVVRSLINECDEFEVELNRMLDGR